MIREVHHAPALDLLRSISDETVDMVYIDPPFGTNVVQSSHSGSYRDPSGDYVAFLRPHLSEIRRVLKDTGSLCLHLDWHQVHKARCLCDELFGEDNFVNEIIWAYDFGGRGKDKWPRKHDNIVVYSKTVGQHVFNWDKVERIPYMAPGLQKDAARAEAGKVPTDVWWMSIVGTTSKERTGYPTQKPVALVERFIVALTPDEGVVVDCFAGSGTTAAAAIKTGRQFIVGDQSEQALNTMRSRFSDSVTFCA